MVLQDIRRTMIIWINQISIKDEECKIWYPNGKMPMLILLRSSSTLGDTIPPSTNLFKQRILNKITKLNSRRNNYKMRLEDTQ